MPRKHPTSVRTGATLAGALLTACLLAGCLPPPPPPGAPTGVCRPDPFTPEVSALLDAYGAAAHHLTVAVHDDRSGCWYHLRQGQRVSTASVVKVEIMAGVLLRAQGAGRDLTAAERSRIGPMIRNSDNATASALFTSLGGERGLEFIGALLGLSQTDEVGPVWGLTTTTAEDQVRLVTQLVQGPGPVSEPYRDLAWRFLTDIDPAQRWGVRAGVPDGWLVGHKNGFAGSRCCGWRVNSVGYVSDPAGGGYAIAVLSDGWPDQAAGVPLVEAASRVVAGSLAAGPA